MKRYTPLLLSLFFCLPALAQEGDSSFVKEIGIVPTEKKTLAIPGFSIENTLPQLELPELPAGSSGFDPKGLKSTLEFPSKPGYADKAVLKLNNDMKKFRDRMVMPSPLFGSSYESPFYGGSILGLSYGTKLTDRLSIHANPFLSNTYMGPLQPVRGYNVSVNSGINYRLSDRVTLKAVGQYSVNNNQSFMYNPMGGGTYYGGSIEVRISDKIGIEAGMERYRFGNKWVESYYISPVFY